MDKFKPQTRLIIIVVLVNDNSNHDLNSFVAVVLHFFIPLNPTDCKHTCIQCMCTYTCIHVCTSLDHTVTADKILTYNVNGVTIAQTQYQKVLCQKSDLYHQ